MGKSFMDKELTGTQAFILNAAIIIPFLGAMGFLFSRTDQAYDPSCDVHFHTKADKAAWRALEEKIAPELAAERLIIEKIRQQQSYYQMNFADPGKQDLVFEESSVMRYLCDKRGDDTVFIYETVSTQYSAKNNYTSEESGIGDIPIETYVGTTYTPSATIRTNSQHSMRDANTSELLKQTIRGAFAANNELTQGLSPAQARAAHQPQSEKLMQLIEEHHKTFDCDHGYEPHLFAIGFRLRMDIPTIPKHSTNWRDIFRLE